MECILIEVIGKKWIFGQSWYSEDKEYHVMEYPITKEQFETSSFEELKKNFGTPVKCDRCNAEYKAEEIRTHKSQRDVYNSVDGTNKNPGNMFYAPWMHHEENGQIKCMYWDNCNDPRGHLLVVLPNGHYFDTDSRASNCNKPDDRLHRCWEKKGEAPKVTVGGPTSDNGVGSIGMTDWHGYLTNGVLHN